MGRWDRKVKQGKKSSKRSGASWKKRIKGVLGEGK